MSCNILIWEQWDPNLVTSYMYLTVVHKESLLKRYMYITQSTTHCCQLLFKLYSTVYIKSLRFVLHVHIVFESLINCIKNDVHMLL